MIYEDYLRNECLITVILLIRLGAFFALLTIDCRCAYAIYCFQNKRSYGRNRIDALLEDIVFMSIMLLAPLTDSILVEAAHLPQFTCPRLAEKPAK